MDEWVACTDFDPANFPDAAIEFRVIDDVLYYRPLLLDSPEVKE